MTETLISNKEKTMLFFRKVPNPQIGDMYRPRYVADNPFHPLDQVIKIIEIKQNRSGQTWIKYIFAEYEKVSTCGIYEEEWNSFYCYSSLKKIPERIEK